MRFRQSLGVLGGILVLATCTESVVSGEKAAALRTEFGEVRLQNLAIGKTYSVARMASEQLVITNTGSDSLFVHVEPVVPAQHHLQGDMVTNRLLLYSSSNQPVWRPLIKHAQQV